MKTDNDRNILLTGSGDDGTTSVKINSSGSVIWSSVLIDLNFFTDKSYMALDTVNN